MNGKLGINISAGSLAENVRYYGNRFNSFIHVENPNIELSRKLHKLKKLQNFLFSLVGCG